MQFGVLAFLLGQLPGLVLVHVLVDLVGQRHHAAQRPGIVARLVVGGDFLAGLDQAGQFGAENLNEVARVELAGEALGDEAGGAAGDVDVLADEVGIHPADEVVEVEVDVLHRAVELGGEVVAQPFRIEALR